MRRMPIPRPSRNDDSAVAGGIDKRSSPEPRKSLSWREPQTVVVGKSDVAAVRIVGADAIEDVVTRQLTM